MKINCKSVRHFICISSELRRINHLTLQSCKAKTELLVAQKPRFRIFSQNNAYVRLFRELDIPYNSSDFHSEDKETSYVPTKTHPRQMMCLWREIAKKWKK